ncbi:MAG: MFS transporter [Planctomycetota bacterium]|jgi:MFS family permease
MPERPAGRGGAGGWRRTFASLRLPTFRWFWVGLLAHFLAFQMDMIARGYLAFDLTGSVTALGVASIAWGIPLLLLSLVGGAVADRVEKRDLVMVTQVAMALTAFTTAILVQTDLIQLWHIVVMGIVLGAVWSFNIPARQAMVPELVSERNLMNALALNNSAGNTTRVIGPSLAGGLIAAPFFGVAGVYYLISVLYVISALSLLAIPRSGLAAKRSHEPVLQGVTTGLRYVASSPALTVLIGLACAAIILGMPYVILLPAFAEDVYDVGAVGLGVMNTVAGIGAITGSILLAYFSGYPHRAALQLALGVAFGVGVFMFGAAPAFVLALVALALVGLTFNGYLTINNTLIFTHAERELHGRVMSVYLLTWSLMPLAALPMSILADTVGPEPTVAAAGVLVALVIAAVAVLHPAYRRLGAPVAAEAGHSQAGGR